MSKAYVTSCNREISSLKPIAQKAAKLFLDECKKQGVKIFVTEYHRSQERQDYLYEQGRTRPGNIVTWTRQSNHTSGYAWDIACDPPQNLYDEKVIAKAGAIAKKLNIEWGGDWKQKDTPHFQVNANWTAPKQVDKTYEKAVQTLIDKHIIGSGDLWLNDAFTKDNVHSLVIKMANHLNQ